MNYIGSKYKLLPFIEETITSFCSLKNKCLCDIFSGTGIVSRYFSNKTSSIISNDVEYYSYIINKTYLTIKSIDISFLNNIDPINGFIFNQYSQNGLYDRLYFTEYNGKKIDGIRTYLYNVEDDKLFHNGLTSLLEGSDKVANTTSVYGAYLKNIKKSAKSNIELQNIEDNYNNNNVVYNEDALSLIKRIEGDVLYLDPPYNSRQYSSNYHLLNTIAKYDKFEPIGKTGQRIDNYSSSFSSKRKVLQSFDELIKHSNFKYIFMSYNNEGILSTDEIKDVMMKYGTYHLNIKNHKTYKADSNRSNKSNKTIEQIHILIK